VDGEAETVAVVVEFREGGGEVEADGNEDADGRAEEEEEEEEEGLASRA
jgi:hypothetical protein